MQNIEYITGMSAYQIGMVEKRRFNAYMVFSWILQKKHPHLGQVRALLLRVLVQLSMLMQTIEYITEVG